MPVDRAKWRQWYYGEKFISWPCARCGGLVSLQSEKPSEWENADSIEAKDHDAWEPEWIRGRFTIHLECSSCKDPAVVSGWWDVQEDWDDISRSTELISRYYPQYLLPAPRFITLPAETPQSVCDELDRAFAVFWLDPSSCGNRIRAAIERLLDEQRVPKVPSAKDRTTRLTLHKRLELFKSKQPETAELLMAAKWVGNAASHRELSREDAFDGFDLVEHALSEIYSSDRDTVRRIARKINKTKKPRGKSKRNQRDTF